VIGIISDTIHVGDSTSHTSLGMKDKVPCESCHDVVDVLYDSDGKMFCADCHNSKSEISHEETAIQCLMKFHGKTREEAEMMMGKGNCTLIKNCNTGEVLIIEVKSQHRKGVKSTDGRTFSWDCWQPMGAGA